MLCRAKNEFPLNNYRLMQNKLNELKTSTGHFCLNSNRRKMNKLRYYIFCTQINDNLDLTFVLLLNDKSIVISRLNCTLKAKQCFCKDRVIIQNVSASSSPFIGRSLANTALSSFITVLMTAECARKFEVSWRRRELLLPLLHV